MKTSKMGAIVYDIKCKTEMYIAMNFHVYFFSRK